MADKSDAVVLQMNWIVKKLSLKNKTYLYFLGQEYMSLFYAEKKTFG
jgi:hypothetical protein